MKEEAKQQGEEETKTKTISDRKRKANRQNAQCSTGPKIQRGKNRSRQNVVKHGLLVKVLPLHSYEDAEEVAAVSANLIAHLQPQGAIRAVAGGFDCTGILEIATPPGRGERGFGTRGSERRGGMAIHGEAL